MTEHSHALYLAVLDLVLVELWELPQGSGLAQDVAPGAAELAQRVVELEEQREEAQGAEYRGRVLERRGPHYPAVEGYRDGEPLSQVRLRVQ